MPDSIQKFESILITPLLLQRIVSCIDLTRLNESDTEESMIAFFEKATNQYGHVAAVCIYPQFVRLASTQFKATPIKVATVVNFPQGALSLEAVLSEINQVLTEGAQEIDLVFPYMRYLKGDKKYAREFVKACKIACGSQTILKVILETGVLRDSMIIADASRDVMDSGADFVKTSTGKIPQGATHEAAFAMLSMIKEVYEEKKKKVGLKISGGIRHLSQAIQYIQLIEQVMGLKWVIPATFRIGASQLINEILARREDGALSAIAKVRDTSKAKRIKHKDAWK